MKDEIPYRISGMEIMPYEVMKLLAEMIAENAGNPEMAAAMRELAASLKPGPNGLILKQPVMNALARVESLRA